ncbi:MAG: ZIP family metal transporter, partial [Candidatus Peribacteraceae bacterium]|nr:ZIP family metal transporter [Candidatus Peribacteraceae bacterium]
MMSSNTLTLLAVLAISLISLIGVLPFALSKKAQSLVLYFVSFSVGALLGDVFLHILPEMAEQLGGFEKGGMYVLLGIVLSFILEKMIHWRHCHILPDEAHEHCHEHHHHIGIMSLCADGLHNFIDGALIAGSFLVDINVGIATTIAVALHEIPQELGDFAVLLHAGYARSKALLFNFLTG